MDGKHQEKKKSTIFKIFLVPLIAIMLVQGTITIGTLIAQKTTKTLEEYSSSMMSRLVENRQVILQNDMNQKWSAIYEQEHLFNERLKQFLSEENLLLEEALQSDELKIRLLEQMFPLCLDILPSSSTTGIFLILTGEDIQKSGEFDGFFIRDSEPDTNPANHTDLLLERGSKQLSRTWSIPLDTGWTTHFSMDGLDQNPADSYFYEPWRCGAKYQNTDTSDLGYWALPFTLNKNETDSYEMITYSIPLRYEGKVYGVLGIEISCQYLGGYFPVAELNDSQQSGYMLAVKGNDDNYTSLTGKGILYTQICSQEKYFSLQKTGYDSLYQVRDVKMNGEKLYAVVCPLKLYGNNAPYENTEWTLLGLDTEEDLFGMSRQLYLWMLIAILIGLVFGILGVYFLIRHLIKPIQRLMHCINKGEDAIQTFELSNILEIDALYDAIRNLTERQKETENTLLEETERYKVALESSEDVFFSYDLKNQILDLINHKTMNGQWQCPKTDCGFINPDYIYEPDRTGVAAALQKDADHPYAEFRIRWPEKTEFIWVALTGKAIYDTDGRRWKLVGRIQNIQARKEWQAKQLEKAMTDSVTGLYSFHAGMQQLAQIRREQPDGIIALLCLVRLQETKEKNGTVFGDMILEEIGNLIQEQNQTAFNTEHFQSIALRFNQNEFILWLGGQSKPEATKFTKDLLNQITFNFDPALDIQIYAGLADGESGDSEEELIRKAKLAQNAAYSDTGHPVCFYEDIPPAKRTELPAPQGQDVDSLVYDKNAGLVSIALNLFGKGDDFSAQMMLMIQKIGRFYQADAVLVSLLHTDFSSNYLNYQWHQNKKSVTKTVRKYTDDEKYAFYQWLDQSEVRYFSKEDSQRSEIQCFLSVEAGQGGILLPMYDNGNYIGNFCILGLDAELLNDSKNEQDFVEFGRAIQSQLNQHQHDIVSRAKSEFLSRMSHEIRTPMNGIIGMTAIALQNDQSPDRIIDCLQKIQTSSNYLLGLINDILDMSKIESGKMKLEPVNFKIEEMLDTICELVATQAAAKNISFSQDITLTHHWFFADQMRISQVLINLLGNAVKFTPENGRIILTVRETNAAKEKTSLFFSVTDTGIGINKEDQERVFSSFEQSSNSNYSSQKGTGLGLSISSRLVQMMGSNIRLESEPGKGSEFSFMISIGIGKSEEAETETEEISFEGHRILVVEDNELNAEIAQCLLEERGFKVECVHDGAQAVERIQSTAPETYDVILMDIMMPVMDGLEAARTIRGMERTDCHTIPIIAMSANAFDDDLKKSIECGMNGHLSKPVEVEKLYQTLHSVLQTNKEKL